MYAVIESCGKQYKVAEGDVVFFEKLDTEAGKKVSFDKVVLVSDDGKVQVGNPYVKGLKVEGKVVSHGKGKKIIVFKMKAKKNERTKQGHRQPYTKDEITGIKNEIEALNKQVKKLDAQVIEIQQDIADTYTILGERIRASYMSGSASSLEYLLTSDNFQFQYTFI